MTETIDALTRYSNAKRKRYLRNNAHDINYKQNVQNMKLFYRVLNKLMDVPGPLKSQITPVEVK